MDVFSNHNSNVLHGECWFLAYNYNYVCLSRGKFKNKYGAYILANVCHKVQIKQRVVRLQIVYIYTYVPHSISYFSFKDRNLMVFFSTNTHFTRRIITKCVPVARTEIGFRKPYDFGQSWQPLVSENEKLALIIQDPAKIMQDA